MKIDLDNMSFEEICALRNALEKMPNEPQLIALKLTKEEPKPHITLGILMVNLRYRIFA